MFRRVPSPKLVVVLAVGLTAACSDAPLLAPPAADDAAAFGTAPSITERQIKVMTWNLYIGADVDAVIGALASPDPDDDLPALLAAIETLEATAFPVRAQAIAGDIARLRPHVIGLQEVSAVDIDLTGLGIPVHIDLDFLTILQTALAQRGLNYVLGAIVQNVAAEPFPGISVVDHDAILVDADRVSVTSKVEQSFVNNIGVVAPGVELKRGWVAVTATIGGASFTFANTHLESGSGAELSLLRAAQATELVAALGESSPAFLMGDLNDEPGSLMHQVVSGAGYTDVWAALKPGTAGFTCCHLPDLSDKIAPFDQRIDYVFERGVEPPAQGVVGQVIRLGVLPKDRISGPVHPIWPSDHAGVVASLFGPAAGTLVATAAR